jgi:phosphosulfolactate synthase (CoM biosynthesis protein A)
MILVESEGLTENRKGEPYRWDVIDQIASAFEPSQLMFEADDQDVLSRFIDVFGPKTNLMIDHSKVEKLEAARRGFGPSQSLWGKVVTV